MDHPHKSSCFIKNIRKSLHLCFTLLLLVLTTTSCSQSRKDSTKDTPYLTDSTFLLDTTVSITIYDKQDKDIIQESFDLIRKYESIYSRLEETSELYALNHGKGLHNGLTYQLSAELSDLIQYGLYYSKLSDGAFDITIAPITSLWDFHAANPVLPKKQEITKALPYVGYQNVSLDGTELTFKKDGMGIELGAIAKGYIADRVKDFLLSKGVKSAMINLGGNVLCVGSKPDGSPFKVGIQKPFADRNETIEIMQISDLSVVSSGIYERCFTVDGKLYHHILNPRTGYSYDNNLISVTIISKKSVDGDGLSTSCFALGLENGLKLIESIPDTHAVFITADYEVHYSKGFTDAIKLIDEP